MGGGTTRIRGLRRSSVRASVLLRVRDSRPERAPRVLLKMRIILIMLFHPTHFSPCEIAPISYGRRSAGRSFNVARRPQQRQPLHGRTKTKTRALPRAAPGDG